MLGERSAIYIVASGERWQALTYVIQDFYKITVYIATMTEKMKVESDTTLSSVESTGVMK